MWLLNLTSLPHEAKRIVGLFGQLIPAAGQGKSVLTTCNPLKFLILTAMPPDVSSAKSCQLCVYLQLAQAIEIEIQRREGRAVGRRG